MLHGDVVAVRATSPGSPRGAVVVDPDQLVVVVQSDALDALATVIVAPLATDADAAEYRPEIAVGARRVRVCCDLLRAEPRSALGAIVARLDAGEQAAVDAAVRSVFTGAVRDSPPRRG